MSLKNIHTKKKSRRKWPWVLLLCFFGLLGLIRAGLMTDPVHRWVKDLIVNTANKQLDPRLSIEDLSGDLWNDITLTGVKLTKDTTVAKIDTVHLEYNPLSYFSDTFQIHEVRLVHPFIKVAQLQDSTWNVQQWVETADTASVDTTGSTFAFAVSDLSINEGQLDVSIPQLQKDSAFFINRMNLASSLGYYGDSYEATIANFNFDVKNTRLDSTVSFALLGDGNTENVTLQKLAITTGNSLLKASGQASFTDSTADFEAEATPLSWKDLAAYAEDIPVRQDINLSLQLSGNPRQFQVRFNAESQGIEQLSLNGKFNSDSVIALTSFRASAKRLDLETFFGDTSMPRLQNLDFQSQGRVPLNQYQQANIEGTLSAENISQRPYKLDLLQGSFSLDKGIAKIQIEPEQSGERIIVDANLSRIWEENPSIFVSIEGASINPARWLQNQAYTGNLSFYGEVSGSGWYPERKFWTYNLSVGKGSLMNQSVNKARFNGRFNQQMITNESQLEIADSKLSLEAEVRQLQSVPRFSYSLDMHTINLSDFAGMQNYPSSITGTVQGSGQGTSLENLKMQTSMKMDSSTFAGEMITNLKADAHLANSVANIQNTVLKSTIADADLSARIHLQNLYEADNTLNFDLQLKDLSSLAFLTDTEILLAKGSIEGKLKPSGQDSAVFDGRMNLEDINYNNQFVASEINGGVRVDLEEEPRYLIDFDISKPVVSSLGMQNMDLKTQGRLTDTTTTGTFEFELAGEREGRIFQAGAYRLANDSTSIELNEFNLTSSVRTLSLERPFHATLVKNALQTDTLLIASEDDSSFLKLAIPYADTLNQQAYIKGEQLNLAVIQNAILDEPLFEGVLSSEVAVERTDTSLTASGEVMMTNLLYKNTKLDTLSLQAHIEEERLSGMMKLYQDSALIAEGDLDIPIKAEKPGQLTDNFFEKPVSGHLMLHAIELNRFSELLDQAGYKNTNGVLRFNASLEGQTGQPKLDATLSLRKAKLSGVPVDSLIASIDYQHEQSNLNLNMSLTSLKQKVVEVDADMPLDVDLSNFEVSLPGPQDRLSVDILTQKFNLQALNDFLNRDMARNLQGIVDGQVKLMGPRSDLQTSGKITLQKGAVRVVPVGIRLDHIRSTIQFEPDRIVLADLHMESGKGKLDGKGELGIEKLVPGDVDVSISAENFKAANTDEYNALINLDLKMEGSVDKPNVSGKLEMINGFVELDNFGEKSVEKVSLDTTAAPEMEISLYDSLSLDMDVEFNRRFFVRNQRYLEMEIELEGQVDLLKDTGKDLQIFGTLNTAGGYARPLGKQFELEEGSLAFSGPPANPQVNVRTLYEPPQAEQEIKIWYIIEGTVEDPQFKYESKPPMDLAGIISYTLFGQPYYKLNPTEQSVASSSSNNAAADFAMEILLDRVESLATQRLGIDVVRIENTRVGGESGTSVTTGWYINPKVFFAIQNIITGSTPTTGFYLEYYLKEHLKLILSQGNDNRQGVDLQWENDY